MIDEQWLKAKADSECVTAINPESIMSEVVMVYDNGESYSDHSIEFYWIKPLTMKECKRLVFLLGTRSTPGRERLTPPRDDVPFVRGFITVKEWYPLFIGKYDHNSIDYNRIDDLKDLIKSRYWIDFDSMAKLMENLWIDDSDKPTLPYMQELKSLLKKIGVEYGWFKDVLEKSS